MLTPEGYLAETWAIVSGQYQDGPIKGLTDGDPSVQHAMRLKTRADELAARERLLEGNNGKKDVEVRRTTSAAKLMAAVLATGGVGTK